MEEERWCWEDNVGWISKKVARIENDNVYFIGNSKPVCSSLTFKTNSHAAADMTSLQHVSEPSILQNLMLRSYEDHAYTWLGTVLVTVNPLAELPEPEIGANFSHIPHPFAVAERAFQSMCFARNITNTDCNQSIVISGESGAGKSECAKRVIKKLVSSSNSSLEKSLIAAIPVLENFGNATTVANHNSSRFGKLTQLFFQDTKRIVGGAIRTYLLEKSRVVNVACGERNFHVFYRLIAGASPKLLDELSLCNNVAEYRILKAGLGIHPMDKMNFGNLQHSLQEMQLSEFEIHRVFAVIAAILHIGNIEYVEGELGQVGISEDTLVHHENASRLLQISSEALASLLCNRIVTVSGQVIQAQLNIKDSKHSRDGLLRAIYTKLFNWVVIKSNRAFEMNFGTTDNCETIGVLDIFGFENFKTNSLEQLCINYCNEALQSTFTKQILIAEAALFRKEGLVVDIIADLPPADESSCVALLYSTRRSILWYIEDETKTIQPKVSKLLSLMHKAFADHPAYETPHRKNMDSQFSIHHFAGKVTYSCESFLEKNTDKAPLEAAKTFDQSSDQNVVAKLFFAMPNTKSSPGNRKRSSLRMEGVCSKFGSNIARLILDLESTTCSFIRCIKPNKEMVRTNQWFDRSYVCSQLRYLSIPSCAIALQAGGLPLRLSYHEMFKMYNSVLPHKDMEKWIRNSNRAQNFNLFTRALFYALQINSNGIKFGLTKVFFKTGAMEKITSQLQDIQIFDADQVTKRFTYFLARRNWKKAFATICVLNRFKARMNFFRAKNRAAQMIQKFFASISKRKGAILVIQHIVRSYLFKCSLLRKKAEEKRKQIEKEKLEAERIRKKNEQTLSEKMILNLKSRMESAKEITKPKKKNSVHIPTTIPSDDTKNIIFRLQENPECSKQQGQYLQILGSLQDAVKKTALMELGVADLITRSMATHSLSAHVQMNACDAVVTLAVNDHERKSLLIQSGVAKSIIQAMRMHPQDTDVQTSACIAVCNLAWDQHVNELLDLQVHKWILKALKIHLEVPEMQTYGMWALRNLTFQNSRSKTELMDSGVPVQILRSMEFHQKCGDVQEQGVCALLNLASNSFENKNLLLKLGATNHLVCAMRSHLKRSQLQENACALLCNLLGAKDENARIFQSVDVKQDVLQAMRRHRNSSSLQQYALQVLTSLAYWSSKEIRSLEMMDDIIETLDRYSHSEEIQRAGICLLVSICKDRKYRELANSKGALAYVNEAKEKFKDDDLQRAAKKYLSLDSSLIKRWFGDGKHLRASPGRKPKSFSKKLYNRPGVSAMV